MFGGFLLNTSVLFCSVLVGTSIDEVKYVSI